MSSGIIRYVPLFLALLGQNPGASQFISSVGQVGGTGGDVIFDMEEAPSGALFATGSFRAIADFDPSTGVFPVAGNGPGAVDYAFVAKYDQSLGPLWVAALGSGAWLDHGSDVASGPGGECVTIGQFQDSGDFDPGLGVAMLTAVDESDVFCVKLDANGALDWAVQFGDTAYDIPSFVEVDALGNVLLGGRFVDTMDVDPGPNIQLIYPEFGNQGLLIKLDPQGGLLWAAHMGYWPQRIILDQDGGILVMGEVGGYMDADPGSGVVPLDEVNGDNYLIRLDPGGNYVSSFQFGRKLSGWGISPVDMELDPLGNMIIAGFFYGSVDMDPGPGSQVLIANATTSYPDMFVAKLDPLGGLLWAFSCGAAGVEQAVDVTVTSSGPIFISGSTYDSAVDLDPGPGTWTSVLFGEEDPFLLAIDPDGNFIGATSFGASGMEYLYGTFQRASGALMGYGVFEGTLDFDPGPGSLPLTSFGEQDIFIAQISSDPSGVIGLSARSPDVRVHPVPTADRLHIRGEGMGAMRFVVSDALGMAQNVPIDHRASDELVLDVGSLPAGHFRIICTSTASMFVRSFVITR